MQPDGRRFVVTGGLGGIGSELCTLLREAGARVTVIDRSAGAQVLQADLGDAAELDRVCAQLAREPVDCLVNLAGLIYFGHLAAQHPQHIAAMLRVNLEAPIRLSQAVIPGMLARGQGQIVNVGSVFGALPFPHFTTYSATKAALMAFSDALRREYAGKGITVCHIAPRAVSTPLNNGLIPELHRRTGVVNDTPRAVAGVIFDALVRGRKRRTIGLGEGLAARLNAVCPALIDRAIVGKRDIADQLLQTSQLNGDHRHAKTV